MFHENQNTNFLEALIGQRNRQIEIEAQSHALSEEELEIQRQKSEEKSMRDQRIVGHEASFQGYCR